MRSVYIIENPLVDYLARVDQDFPDGCGAPRGGMKLVGVEELRRVLEAVPALQIQPGGSGANTARALALLLGEGGGKLGRVAYSGAVGKDEEGRRFDSLLECLGIETALAIKEGSTGVSAVLLTPDHERSMITQLGASREFGPGDVRADILADSRLVYSTAYLWGGAAGEAALERIGSLADEAGIRLCFDLADPEIVRRNRAGLAAWIEHRVSLLMGNREELSALTSCTESDAEILRKARRLSPLVVMKAGRGGCLVSGERRLLHIPGEQVVPQDSTGAGDSFAAGFLYGLASGADPRACGRLANRIASRIVAVEGCRFDLLDRADILAALEPAGS